MKPAIFHDEAEAEFRESIAHYEGERAGLGAEFGSEVEATVACIQRTPQVFSPYDNQGTRRCRVRRFPYTIYYVELSDYVWIAAVAHHRRKPDYWHGRTPG